MEHAPCQDGGTTSCWLSPTASPAKIKVRKKNIFGNFSLGQASENNSFFYSFTQWEAGRRGLKTLGGWEVGGTSLGVGGWEELRMMLEAGAPVYSTAGAGSGGKQSNSK